MSKDITESLARIGEQTARLNQLCDEGAAVVRDLEETLERMNVGIPAAIRISNCYYPEAGYEGFEDLVYQRIGTRFRIGVESGTVDDPSTWLSKPWSDCSREMKLEALSRLPELVSEIAEQVEKRTNEAAIAIKAVKKLAPSTKKKES